MTLYYILLTFMGFIKSPENVHTIPSLSSSTNTNYVHNFGNKYIDKYKYYALVEQELFGIPASITIAQGILESNWGKSDVAINKKNHFGIRDTESSYRYFDCDWDSFRMHSKVLSSNRYSKLIGKNYYYWAHGLVDCGYVKSNSYSWDLISIIEKNQLYLLDENK